MGNQQQLEQAPLQIAFSYGFIYVETDKHVYYPGDTINGCVHLMINKPLTPGDSLPVKCLDLRLRGKETFKFTTAKKEESSTKNHYLIFDNQQTLAHFHQKSIAMGQYTFTFKFTLPGGSSSSDGNSISNSSQNQQPVVLPASYMQKQFIMGRGDLKIRIRYSIDAVLRGHIKDQVIAKYSQRFFVAKTPISPEQNINKQHTCRIRGWFKNLGWNQIENELEKNYFVIDEPIRTKTIVDNRRSQILCSKIIVKLMRQIVCRGHNGYIFSYKSQVARAESQINILPGQISNYGDETSRLICDLLLDYKSNHTNDENIDLNNNDNQLTQKQSRKQQQKQKPLVKFDEIRGNKHLGKPFKPEDLHFARHIQPSTKGSCVEVSYEIEITREFGKRQGIFQNADKPGVVIPITLNPSTGQCSDFPLIEVPQFWKSHNISCENQDQSQLSTLLNEYYDPIIRKEDKKDMREEVERRLQQLQNPNLNSDNPSNHIPIHAVVDEDEVNVVNQQEQSEQRRPLLGMRLFQR